MKSWSLLASSIHALVVSVLLAGCGAKDPCAGQSGVCIAALVTGNVQGLDQLRVGIDGPLVKTVLTPSTPSPLTLPTKIAVVLPAGTKGIVNLGIDGLSAGRTIATAPRQAVPLPPAGTVTFTLHAGAPVDMQSRDLSVADLTVGPDLLVSSFTISGSGSFAATPRATTSGAIAALDVTQTGNVPGVPGAPTITGPNASSFAIASTTCGSDPVLPAQSCTVNVSFTPRVSGSLSATLSVAGTTAPLSGTGTPVWVLESLGAANSGAQITSVAATATDAWAAGPSIFHSTGNGSWSAADINGVAYVSIVAIGPSSSAPVAVHGAELGYYTWSGAQWVFTALTATWQTPIPILNIGVDSNNDVWLVGKESGQPAVAKNGSDVAFVDEGVDGGAHGVALPGPLTGVTGNGGGLYINSLSGLSYCPTANMNQCHGLSSTGYVTQWSDATGLHVWVSDPNSGALRKATVSGSGASFAVTFSNETLPISGGYVIGVGGRFNGTTLVEMYGLYSDGTILYSTGNGTWTKAAGAPAVPLSAAASFGMNPVFVRSTGDVYIGGSGAIAHYY